MSTAQSRISITDLSHQLRWFWLLNAALVPWITLIGIIPAEMTGNVLWLAIGYPLFYLGIPVLDLLMGEDPNNHSEDEVPALDADNYFRWMLAVSLVSVLLAFIVGVAYAGYRDLGALGLAAFALSLMGFGGALLNLAHEMGHKREWPERLGARIALGFCALPHFCIEHNRGHHRDVATPEDHASSRLGENFYQFMWREMTGTWRRGWQLEAERLRSQGKSFWHIDNEVLQASAITLVFFTAVAVYGGASLLAFIVVVSFLGHTNLSLANYVEHYGLLRSKLENGRYEPPKPKHSWNQNSLVSNLVTMQLQRHSDHHAHPSRRYQCLRHFEDVPQLPAGYYVMFLLAWFPPLWFRVMDEKVLDWAGRDLSRINVHPPAIAHYRQLLAD